MPEKEEEPLFDITELVRISVGGFVRSGGMFSFGDFGIGREIDKVFAGEFFALVTTSGEFLIFLGKIIFIFEFESFNFEFEKGFFALAVHEFLGQGPVASHGRD